MPLLLEVGTAQTWRCDGSGQWECGWMVFALNQVAHLMKLSSTKQVTEGLLKFPHFCVQNRSSSLHQTMAEPTEKEISVPWPTKTAITVQLTTPPKGVKLSGFALVLGPGAGNNRVSLFSSKYNTSTVLFFEF